MSIPVGPDFIALQVRDLAASAKFYENVFGFSIEAQSPPGAVVLRTKPISLALRNPLRPLPNPGHSVWASPYGSRAMTPINFTN
jgi:catechol 2,3-dioxygenase-like lactoylglutathione lyase family enzyme